MEEEEAVVVTEEVEKLVVHTYPLVKTTDLPDDVVAEIMDFTISACEKYPDNYENVAKTVKQQLDMRYGPPWNVVVGENYGFNFGYLVGCLLHMYCLGMIACVMWKAPQT